MRLHDILFAITRLEEYAAHGQKQYRMSPLLQDGIIRQMSVIGEAATKLPVRVKAAYPAIPWKRIAGMRNILIHDYADIDLDLVWHTVERDLPVLRSAIEAMLDDAGS